MPATKPWDHLRSTPKPLPIKVGGFTTTDSFARVDVTFVSPVSADLSIPDQSFYKSDLLELAEFATELAEQLD